jgi:hypothetical protein
MRQWRHCAAGKNHAFLPAEAQVMSEKAPQATFSH